MSGAAMPPFSLRDLPSRGAGRGIATASFVLGAPIITTLLPIRLVLRQRAPTSGMARDLLAVLSFICNLHRNIVTREYADLQPVDDLSMSTRCNPARSASATKAQYWLQLGRAERAGSRSCIALFGVIRLVVDAGPPVGDPLAPAGMSQAPIPKGGALRELSSKAPRTDFGGQSENWFDATSDNRARRAAARGARH
jgi:hypothetical protein